MALQLTFSPAATTPQGLEISSAYASISSFAFDRAGSLSYVVAYYASAAARQAGKQPLALVGVPAAFNVLLPAPAADPVASGVPAPLYVPLSAAQANAAGALTLAYQHLATRLAELVPGLAIAQA